MSEQPIAPIRQSSFSDAVTIGALNAKLAEANAELAKWKIKVLADVVSTQSGFGVKLNVYKENGQGIIKTIETPDVLYYQDDQAGLIDIIVNDVFEHLFKQLIRNELTPFISRGVRNAAQRVNAQLGIKS